MNIDRKKVAIFLIVVTVAAIMSGIALSVYATDNGEEVSDDFAGWMNRRMMMVGTGGWSNGFPRGRGCHGVIEVSEEFEENVLNMAESDQDVLNLLDDGYSIKGVRPIIKTIVEADGNVTMKASSAIVMLEKDTTGYASVWVDLEQAKVTKIVILTRTVIEKP